jgi:hypothetical protein
MLLYALTLFLSAALLFVVQPMFARMALPLLGGSPAVWNTAQVFFQAALLAGYAYAHLLTRRFSVRHQVIIHLGLLLLPFLLLPIRIPTGWASPTTGSPALALLGLMAVTVGLPFFLVSASSPLLQHWFTRTGHRLSDDPYFLNSISNGGSLLALLSYPLLIAPTLNLSAQSQTWTGGYVLLLILFGVCAVLLWRSTPAAMVTSSVSNRADAVGERLNKAAPNKLPKSENTEHLTLPRRARWVLLAFVPSSLMLSVTTYLSTDIAPIPLLWIIPLALYLLTFALVFARTPSLPHKLMIRLLPIALLVLAAVMVSRETEPLALLVPLHLITFFLAAMVCHGEIARDRPAPDHLTEFYFWMAIGGVLGGAFNTLVAPLLFNNVAEYPLLLVVAGLLLPASLVFGTKTQSTRGQKRRREQTSNRLMAWWQQLPSQRQKIFGYVIDFGIGLALFGLTLGLITILQDRNRASSYTELSMMFGLPVLVCAALWRWPVRFGLGLAGILLAGNFYTAGEGQVLYAKRTFFGIHRVILDHTKSYHLLIHGTTLHGMQSLDPARQKEPLAYYYANGPLGQIFDVFSGDPSTATQDAKRKIADVGLGAGSAACYSQPGQQWTFYEIDPVVERIARDSRYFTFLQTCAPNAQIKLGDARLELASAQPGEYGLMLLDAYSSDAMPVHLITREALRLYLDKLEPDGVLAFHISNRHFDLQTVLGHLAADAGLEARVWKDAIITPVDARLGKSDSEWLVMARSLDDLGSLADDPHWQPPKIKPGTTTWSDDFYDLLSVLR